MYTQLVNNLDELGFTEIEPFLSEHLTTAAKKDVSLQESLLRITEREISLRNQRAAQNACRMVHLSALRWRTWLRSCRVRNWQSRCLFR